MEGARVVVEALNLKTNVIVSNKLLCKNYGLSERY